MPILPVAAMAAAALLAGAAPSGRDAFLARETVEVRTVKGPLPADPADALWAGLPATIVQAAPQRSVRLHDRRANEALARAGIRTLRIRAATDGTALAVVVDWSDASADRARPDATDVYGDGAALELPLRFGAGRRLPYVGMGDAEEPVAVYLQRAAEAGVLVREAVGGGFGSLTRAELGEAQMAMRHDGATGTWRALFRRPLVTNGQDLRRGLVPFAVAVWDGGRSERGGNKALTRWKFLRLPGQPLDATWTEELSWGYTPGELGDPAKGRTLVEAQCTACHVAGPDRTAPPGLAPDLSAVGVVSTPSYLRDSIVRASAVVVPSPNPAQHQDRSRGTDARGAWPLDPGYAWHGVETDGRRSSSMPDFELTKEELGDAVAYLMTLGGEPGEGSRP